jgi:hypothetical protein
MKPLQTMSYSIVGALSLALIPGITGCRSQDREASPAPETTTGMETSTIAQEVNNAVQIADSNTPQQTGGALQATDVNRFAGGVETNIVVAIVPEMDPLVVMTTTAVGPSVIDLAICLDTSGSMDGLIDSAKQTLWSIVNDMALVEPAPTLRVALLTFGNDGHSEENGWVFVDAPLTSDLDLISQKLFGLSTNGGTEFVGRVVDAATSDLAWSTDPNALKLLVVAGNESADQDPKISFREASKKAITAGIMVNSIYCGDAMDQLAPAWREVALLADGHFSSIDQNNGMVVIDTPFDEELSALTASVNGTYVPWGTSGQQGWMNQSTQDSNNRSLNNDAMAQRAMAKNSALYSCSWDLVDATKANQVEFKDVNREFLSEELKAMTDEELKAHVASMGEKRTKIQADVTEVSAKREAWLVKERTKLKVDDSNALDRVLRDAIRAQAATKGLKFKQTVTAPLQAVVTPKADDC